MASQLRVNKSENRSGLGTITYTDTGAIVSGIVTANSFSGDIIGDITGAVTATTGSFSGDVSIAEKIIHTGDTNTFMKFDTDTVTFETAGDERLRITSGGSVLLGGVTSASNAENFRIHTASSNKAIMKFTNTDTGSGAGDGLEFGLNSSEHAELVLKEDKDIIFYSGATTTEKLRITHDGKVGINQTPTRELSLHSPNNNNSQIHFTNDDTGETASDGIVIGLDGNEDLIVNNQESNKNIRVFNSGGERLRIDSHGCVRVGNTATQTTSGNTKRIALGAKGSIQGWVSGQLNGHIQMIDNYYWDGANNKAIESDHCAFLSLRSGTLRFGSTNSSQTAGQNVSGGINERFRITAAGVIQCGTSAVLKAEINNAVSGHQFISQCSDNNTGFEIYQQHGTTSSRNTLGVYDNRTGSKKPTFVVRGDGHFILDTTSNGYGGLKIYDDSTGDYNVRYIAGRNQGATSHVFMRSGRTQNQSPWADATPVEHARITRGGIAFGGDTADNNTLNDYEEGTFTPSYSGTHSGLSGNQRHARYTKIGNMVFYSLEYYNSSNAASWSSGFELGGMPYASSLNELYCSPSIGVMYGPSGYAMDADAAGRIYHLGSQNKIYFKFSASGVRHLWIQFFHRVEN